MRRVKKACVSSSAIPSWWSTQPSRVTLMLKVKSPMVSSVRDTRRYPACTCAGLGSSDVTGRLRALLLRGVEIATHSFGRKTEYRPPELLELRVHSQVA